MNKVIVKFLENDGRDWYQLNGTDDGTKWNFDNEIYGVAKDGAILDSDGCPLAEGNQKIAVLNSIY
jgi:hypothetical protein